MEFLAKMKMVSINSRTMTILGVLLFATLVTGCYDSGYYGSPSYYGSPGYGGNTYYSKNVYRGYGSYPQPGLFGGYAPAHEAWDDSSRGRTSYGGGAGGRAEEHGGGESGEHGGVKSGGHGGGESSGHGSTASGGGPEGVSGHGH